MNLRRVALPTVLAFVAQASFAAQPAGSEMITLKGESAVAYGDDGKPMFRGPRDYVLAAAKNKDGHITLYDAERGMVRISDKGGTGVWLSCTELLPMENACSAMLPAPSARHRPSRGGGAHPAPLGSIPACPGDPRCPHV